MFAYDHRGHGRGIRSKRAFRLDDVADDVIAVADALGIDRFIPVGYSMGGAVAQLVWHRHRERVDGLVLCATAPYFAELRGERLSFLGLTGLAALARVTPAQAREWLTEQFYLQRKSLTWEPWAVQQAASHDWRMMLEAGSAIGNFTSSAWIGQIDVPTSIVVTMRDGTVPLRRQVELFDSIPGAEAFRVDGEHDAVVTRSDQFVPTLLRAHRVRRRPRRSRAGGRRPPVASPRCAAPSLSPSSPRSHSGRAATTASESDSIPSPPNPPRSTDVELVPGESTTTVPRTPKPAVSVPAQIPTELQITDLVTGTGYAADGRRHVGGRLRRRADR